MGFKCDKCGAEISENAKFCNKCGNKFQGPTCRKCGEVAQPGDKFCGSCGIPLADQASIVPEPDGQAYDGSWRLTDVVRDWFKAMEWEDIPELDKVSGISRTGFLVDAKGSECTCYLEAWEAHEICKLFMYCSDIEVPTDRVGECLVLANEINNNRALGYFTVVTLEKTMIRFYVSIDVEEATFEPRHIHNMYHAAITNMEIWIPKFLAVCNDRMSAADAFAQSN